MSLTDLGRCIRRALGDPPAGPWANPEPPESQERRIRRYIEGLWPQWDRFREGVGIPYRLAQASLDGCESTPAIERVREFLNGTGDDSFGEGGALILAGATGVGKTYAAVAALRSRWWMHSEDRGFFYFPALCTALLDPDRQAAALHQAKTRHFMVFDDFGVEYVKEGGLIQTFLDEIIWEREGNYLPTIITTNLTGEQIKERVSSRIVDRLRGWAAVYAVPGASLRTKG